jgi:hypothetical protein
MATELEGDMRPSDRTYPWNDWFNGRQWDLRRGEDFKMPVDSFRAYAYRMATKRGLKLSTQIIGEAENATGLLLQANPKREAPKAPPAALTGS